MDVPAIEAKGYCRHCGKRHRRVNAWHLRKHGYDDDHPVLDHEAEFDLRFASSADSRQ